MSTELHKNLFSTVTDAGLEPIRRIRLSLPAERAERPDSTCLLGENQVGIAYHLEGSTFVQL